MLTDGSLSFPLCSLDLCCIACPDRPIAQAVRRLLANPPTRVPSQVEQFRICCVHSDIEDGFLSVVQLALKVIIPLDAPQSTIIPVCTLGQLVTDIPNGLRLIQQYQIRKESMFLLRISLSSDITYRLGCSPEVEWQIYEAKLDFHGLYISFIIKS